MNDLIAGLQWVAQHIEKYPGPAVVSMSLEVPQSDVAQAISDQVAELLAMSVSVVSAAGNDHDGALQHAQGQHTEGAAGRLPAPH